LGFGVDDADEDEVTPKIAEYHFIDISLQHKVVNVLRVSMSRSIVIGWMISQFHSNPMC
jgi:hypothetical protein